MGCERDEMIFNQQTVDGEPGKPRKQIACSCLWATLDVEIAWPLGFCKWHDQENHMFTLPTAGECYLLYDYGVGSPKVAQILCQLK